MTPRSRSGRRASTFLPTTACALMTVCALTMTLVSLAACDRGPGISTRTGGLEAAPAGLSALVMAEYQDRQAALAEPGPGSSALSPAILALLAPTSANKRLDLPSKGPSVGTQVVPASAPKPHKPRAHRYPGYRQWSSRDCTGLIRHDTNYCESRDCTAIVRHDTNYCESRDCTGYIRNDTNYCESRSCTAIVRHDTNYCN